MGQVSSIFRDLSDGNGGKSLLFWCPGCEMAHHVYISGDQSKHPVWGFNGNYEKPTFTPSILVQYRHPKGYSSDNPAPKGYNGPYEEDICHSFVRDGQIQFLGDCTHKLRNQTVPIPPLPDHWKD